MPYSPGFTSQFGFALSGKSFDDFSSVIDTGQRTDGGHYTPTIKGTLVHDDSTKEESRKSNIERGSITFSSNSIRRQRALQARSLG